MPHYLLGLLDGSQTLTRVSFIGVFFAPQDCPAIIRKQQPDDGSDNEDEDEDEIRTYSYDSQGRMIKCVYDENQIVTYTYKSNQIVVNGLEDGEEIWKLNDNGYIVQGESEDEEIAYTYDNLDQLQKMEYTDGDIHIFTWRDGNIVKVVEAFGEVYESTSEFTYSSVENKVDFDFSSYLGDYHFYDELYNGSYFGKPNKNLVLTCQTKEGNEKSN